MHSSKQTEEGPSNAAFWGTSDSNRCRGNRLKTTLSNDSKYKTNVSRVSSKKRRKDITTQQAASDCPSSHCSQNRGFRCPAPPSSHETEARRSHASPCPTSAPTRHNTSADSNLVLRVVAQINRLRVLLRLHAAPRLAPQPFLRKRIDRNLILDEVRQILIQIRQGIRVLSQTVVHTSKNVTHTPFP